MPNVDPSFGGDPHSSPEHKLFQSVLITAIRDLFHSKPPIPEWVIARDEGMSFLTEASGKWAQSREHICLIIGMNPDNVRKLIVDILEGGDPPDISYLEQTPFGKGLKDARELWAKRKAHIADLQARADARPKRVARARTSYERQLDALVAVMAEST